MKPAGITRRSKQRNSLKDELMVVSSVKLDLQETCLLGFKSLDTLRQTELTTELKNRAGFRKMMNDAINSKSLPSMIPVQNALLALLRETNLCAEKSTS